VNSYVEALREQPEVNVMMVCLGNICRSPMAAAVLANRSLEIVKPKIVVSSSGTGSWHIGEGPNLKSKQVWEESGYQYDHTVQQFHTQMFNSQDLLLVMDRSNYENVIKLSNSDQDKRKVYFLRQFDPALNSLDPHIDYKNLEVPDPYYEPIDAYRKVLAMVESSITGLLDVLVGRK
jgi:protein-tyrosine phosphatase